MYQLKNLFGKLNYLFKNYFFSLDISKQFQICIDVIALLNVRVFVGTWNVGGRAPHEGLNLNDWLLSTPSPADLYVLGFVF